MNLKKLLFLLIMPCTISNMSSSTNNFSAEDQFKKYIEEQQKINIQFQKDLLDEQKQANNAQKEREEKIIQLLAVSLQLEAEKIENDQKKEAARQAALQKESEKGFTFTECGIVIRDTFLEEFNLRTFSTEFCQGVVKTFKRLVLNKAIQETFNGVDYTFGTALTRYVHPQAGIYPVTFLQSNSFSEYTRQRQNFIDKEDPRVKALHNQANTLLKEARLTVDLLKAQERLEAVQKTIDQESPEAKELKKQNDELLKAYGINPSLVKEEERLKEIIKLIALEHPLVKIEKQTQNSMLLESGYLIATQIARDDTTALAQAIRKAQHEQKNNQHANPENQQANPRIEVIDERQTPSADNEENED